MLYASKSFVVQWLPGQVLLMMLAMITALVDRLTSWTGSSLRVKQVPNLSLISRRGTLLFHHSAVRKSFFAFLLPH